MEEGLLRRSRLGGCYPTLAVEWLGRLQID